jgi:hypothetical protein
MNNPPQNRLAPLMVDELSEIVNVVGRSEAQRELRIKFSSHLTAADLDHAVEVGTKVRPETSAALFEAWASSQ